MRTLPAPISPTLAWAHLMRARKAADQPDALPACKMLAGVTIWTSRSALVWPRAAVAILDSWRPGGTSPLLRPSIDERAATARHSRPIAVLVATRGCSQRTPRAATRRAAGTATTCTNQHPAAPARHPGSTRQVPWGSVNRPAESCLCPSSSSIPIDLDTLSNVSSKKLTSSDDPGPPEPPGRWSEK
jgi:hypothetical protein